MILNQDFDIQNNIYENNILLNINVLMREEF